MGTSIGLRCDEMIHNNERLYQRMKSSGNRVSSEDSVRELCSPTTGIEALAVADLQHRSLLGDQNNDSRVFDTDARYTTSFL